MKELADSMQDETKQHKGDVIKKCPFCQSQQTVKNGRIKGKQKYKCKDCQKSYSKHTGTIAHGIKRREKFDEYKSVLFTEGLLPLKHRQHELELVNKQLLIGDINYCAHLPQMIINLTGLLRLMIFGFYIAKKGDKD